MDLLTLFGNDSSSDRGVDGGNEDEQLCRVIAWQKADLLTNETAFDIFLRECIRNLNQSNNNTSGAPNFAVTTDVIIIAIYCILCIGCILGNIIVISVIIFNKSMRQSVTNVMVINLAVADFCVGIFSGFQAFIESGSANANQFAQELCKFQQVLQVAMLAGTVCILLIICVDRYLAIVYPMSQRQHRRKQWYLAVGCGGWLFAIAFALPNLYFYNYSTSNRLCQVRSAMADYFLAYYCASVVLLFALPLLVMSLAYGRVSIRLLSSIHQFGVEYTTKSTRNNEAEMTTIVTTNETSITAASTEADEEAKAKTKAKEEKQESKKFSTKSEKQKLSNPAEARKRTVQMFVTIVAAFFICKLPKTIYVLILLTNPSVVQLSSALDVTVAVIYLLYVMPSAINPVIYFLFSRQFRAGLISLLHCGR